jgi:hypothetical protein
MWNTSDDDGKLRNAFEFLVMGGIMCRTLFDSLLESFPLAGVGPLAFVSHNDAR